MIAIVILGLGLLVAAAMFPIAWSKARDLSEHTMAENCAAAADLAVKLTCRVDSAEPGMNHASLAGTYLVETERDAKEPESRSDTLVHPLTMQNLLVASPPGGNPVIDEAAWLLTDFKDTLDGGDRYQLDSDLDLALQGYYRQAQVRLGERIYPALPPRPAPTADPEDRFRWDTRVDSRVYAWAVLHRLNDFIPHPIYDGDPGNLPRYRRERRERLARPRVLTMYYVTLRRGAGQRFAQQDEAALAGDDIKAMPHTSAQPTDVKFPSPWLVPLVTPAPAGGSRALNYRDQTLGADVAPRGVPTEVTVEVPASSTNSDPFPEFFVTGAVFIDHVNGQVYHVVKRRVDEGPPLKAFLTLDREIFVEDLMDPPDVADPTAVDFSDGSRLPSLGPERNRRVWIFPPAIERPQNPSDPLIVEGRSPVVDIAVRPLTIYPQ